ncbi:MAG: glycosyltransferase family 2 protein [Bacilli bacterium]|nr:glycosyltransferase family 2 protein [Bacilli bacterium]
MNKKYKICVYAICKNEEKFVDRWVDSMSEADYIYVLDTGSTDNTVDKLRERGVCVTTDIIDPWRFDVARNKSLDLIPKDCDICVCTDLDEVFKSGWREKLEEIWQADTNRLSYNYNWSLDENNNPIVNFYIEKIHSRNDYKWTHPVHEVLTYIGDDTEHKIVTDEITVNHYPDREKSRSSYLPLLELSVEEDPNDDRNMHYLGREYMYYGKWNESIDTLIRHLSLPRAIWKDERCASMRFIARCYVNLRRYDEARMWLDKAIEEAPYLRCPYVERALLEYQLSNWQAVEIYCNKALEIKNHAKSYINEPFSWDHTIYDLLSISYFYQERYEDALNNVTIALQMKPDDSRMLKNKMLIENKLS